MKPIIGRQMTEEELVEWRQFKKEWLKKQREAYKPIGKQLSWEANERIRHYINAVIRQRFYEKSKP